MYSCRILADSLSPAGVRLTTFEITYPRFVHSELMTHRMLSRNSASSRAIPISKMIEQIENDPVMPVWWGKNQSGMQAETELSEALRNDAMNQWLRARDLAIVQAHYMMDIGVHKQIVNRLLEPWMWITVIVSATEWDNFFHLRCHHDAQPEIRYVAEMMQFRYTTETPNAVPFMHSHLPLISEADRISFSDDELKKISVGRCARVSYLTHDGKRDPQADIDLHDRLMTSGHWSPFEHVAQALDNYDRYGNFIGWKQYRKTFENENYEA